jgi:hypothetical protein
MDTHKILMITVIVLALVHLALSVYVYSKDGNISTKNMKNFLLLSSVVCLIIAGLATYCVSM